MMQLHWSPRSPYVRKVMIVAHELGLADRIETVRTVVGGTTPHLALMRDNPLAWVKVCGGERVSAGRRPFEDAIPFAQALIEAAPERVLWGTDWPHPNISQDMPNDGELVDLMFRFCPDQGLRRQLLVDNPVRLYF